ncbi:MAG: DivIVA domain-containing protein, partial [Propionibacteriaceae bacterium]|nr:DivIVA domain-containing protein [Propionibacteriaceae bacterium]
MTLTIEQVRDTRFHLARRNGYDPQDVDTFVDKVETTLVALAEENATLQQQVSTLSADGGVVDSGEAKGQLEAKDAEIESLRAELEQVRGTLESREAELRAAGEGRDEDVQALIAGKDDQLAGKDSELTSKNEELARKEEELAAK